ncbi:unnamed protein product [Clonostachys rhizophaga]|uniref:LDB19 N-terminal domain-containing protein n=1 Tax=Clonostachys rhizophaga TaxID=160324 RepID=A0A9N9VAE9_9HYPO|nr:unnamed protein product [Clonostachys rhizophaga]
MGFTSKLLAPARPEKQSTTQQPISLQWVLQTPTPTLLEGVEAFTGAPVIGETILDTREALDVNKLCTTLHLHRYYKKPIHPKCFHCAHHYAELKQWVFPEARMDAALRMKQVIEPNSINSVWLSLSAIKNHPERGTYIWEPTKVEWKLEETVVATLGICSNHSEDQKNAPDTQKQTVTHTLAKGRIHSGWKSSQGAQGFSSTLKFEYGPISEVATKRKTTYACDEAINNTLAISHALIVEISLSAVTMLLDEAAGSVASNSSRNIRLRRPVVITEPRNDLESVDDALPRYSNEQLDLPAYEEP